MIEPFVGFAAGLGLIVAIGAQNAFVIRQGLRREHVLWVVAICAISDAALILLGVAGLGAIVSALPLLLEVVRWFGVAYLIWFGIRSLRSAFSPKSLQASTGGSTGLARTITTTLMLTYFNPHVYLDTVIFLGSIANQYASPWAFAWGAVAASFSWFFCLGFGARAASRWLGSPKFWRWFDVAVAAVMFLIAASLATMSLS